MCGVIAAVGCSRAEVDAALDLIAHRGPDDRGVEVLDASVLGHVRLAIQDGLGLKDQIGRILASPKRFYRAEYTRQFPPR